MKKSITKTKILFILLILIIGIIGYKNIPVQSNEITPVNDEKPQKNLGIPTEIVKVTKENLVEKISYIGTIQSKETVLVSPKIPAEIVELNIAEGDYVKKGEILARLDDSNIRAKLKTIETKIEKTKINLEYLSGEEEKYKILRDEGAIAKSVYDKIKHEKDMAEAQIKELYATKDELIISLEDTLIRSPINGVVRTLNYSIHELAMVGKPLTIIDDVSNLLVKVKVSESDLKKINKETSVLLTISGTQQKVRSRVSKIMPSMNPKTRIGEVEIADLELEDTNNIVLGSSVQAEFVINEENNTLAIPMDSIKQLIEFDIAQDDSVFTLQMVNNMTSSVLISIVLTILIIMLFISAVNQSLVVSISMPLVFLTTLGLMKLFGMKMDLVTLSALILSIGFVVDASVIVVENIMTHYNDLNKDIVSAAIDGTREIAVPSISGALTTLVVLVPLLFIKGFVGAMFRPLSLTLIFAISSSIVIALVIISLFTVLLNKFKLTKTEKVIEIFSKPFNRMMNSLLNGYVKLLKLAINNKGKTYITILILLVLSGRFLISNGIERH